jgi:hypothetical protein
MKLCMIVLLYFCLYMFSSTSMADLRHGIEGHRRYRDIMPFDILLSTENVVVLHCRISVVMEVQPCQMSAIVNLLIAL